MHLFMNLISLYLGAIFLEKHLNPFKFLVFYLILGIISGLASIFWNTNIISIGASGAIFGLFGIILAFTIFKVFDSEMRFFSCLFLAIFVGFNLIIGLTGFFANVDNAAHIGGLVSGFLLGTVMVPFEKKKSNH